MTTERPSHDQRCGTFSPIRILWERESLEMRLTIDHAYVMKWP